MHAITLENPGAEGRYSVNDLSIPSAAEGEAVIKVAYAGVNRADLLQKQGRYPLPEHTPPVPGMEVSGEIKECGKGVTRFRPGDKVCALLSEGAFAEYAAVNASHVLPVPPGVTLEQAAALPEACFTVWISLVWQAQLEQGEWALIHGGASGIGTIAIQIAKLLGARVCATVRDEQRAALCRRLGADEVVLYPHQDFVGVVKERTQGRGVDVILDMVGGDYFQRNLDALAQEGRLAVIAFLKGAKAEVNLAPVLLKHLKVMGSTLRPRPAHEKARLAEELQDRVWGALAQGAIKPVIDRVFPLQEAEKALGRMDQGLNIGKILLKM